MSSEVRSRDPGKLRHARVIDTRTPAGGNKCVALEGNSSITTDCANTHRHCNPSMGAKQIKTKGSSWSKNSFLVQDLFKGHLNVQAAMTHLGQQG